MASRSTKEHIGHVYRFRQSEALLRNVMENAAVGMVVVGRDAHLLFANRAYAEMLGYEPAECVGLGPSDLVHPDDVADARRYLGELMSGAREGYRTERRYVRKDGTWLWCAVAASSLRDSRSGKPLYGVVQISDIHRRKLAEAELAANESRWNFALEAVGQGVWDHDYRNNTSFYSRAWRQLRGYSPDEPMDTSQEAWLERVHPDDRERVRKEERLQESGAVNFNSFEYRERHRDGHWMWILSRGKPVDLMPDGAVARIIGTDTDITALKLDQAQRAEEKERLRVTLHSIGDGVISTDAAGTITFMNPAAEAMTGWPSTEGVGTNVADVFVIIDEGIGAPAGDPVAECMKRETTVSLDGDLVLVGRFGDERPVGHSASPLRTPDGDIVGAVLVFQDNTQARALQRELSHLARHDSLTGLPNRAAFEAKLADARELAQREQREHALCFIDLDRFKAVNDRAGHAAGDALLREITVLIRRQCRAQDFLGRLGGDEFGLLLPDCGPAPAMAIAQAIVDRITGTRFTWHGKSHEVGACIGITRITPRGPEPAELMNQADIACYAAKARGRNQAVAYSPELVAMEKSA
jgi:diguanylate cyclase (GGDEF)-like protein/PAS domain S-box-containing protein